MNFFSKFQKYFSFLKLFESPSKNIHVYLYTYISKHDISSKRLPYVYASRITRLFSILLARWPRIKDRKSKTGSTFIETEREREREREGERSNRSDARRKRGRHIRILVSTSRSAYGHRSCPSISTR